MILTYCIAQWKQKANADNKKVRELIYKTNLRTPATGISRNRSDYNQLRRPMQVTGRVVQRNRVNMSNVTCYNCKRPGHYASECRVPRKCFSCGRSGHLSRFCRQKQVNYLHVDDYQENERQINCETAQEEQERKYTADYPALSVSNRYEVLSDEGQGGHDTGDETEEIYMTEFTKRIEPTSTGRRSRKKSLEETLIEKQVSFIEGKGPRPRYTDIVVSTKATNKESFRNKPVVKCRLNGDQVHTLMDSGATCNLLSKGIFEVIREKDGCELSETNSQISCANNTNLRCHGEVSLNFSLAGVSSLMNFYVVDGLRNCQAIMGLRSMKKLGINFDFANDCVLVNNIVVPFEAKVSPATTVHKEGNARSLN